MDSTWSPPNPPGLPGVHLEYVEQGKVLWTPPTFFLFFTHLKSSHTQNPIPHSSPLVASKNCTYHHRRWTLRVLHWQNIGCAPTRPWLPISCLLVWLWCGTQWMASWIGASRLRGPQPLVSVTSWFTLILGSFLSTLPAVAFSHRVLMHPRLDCTYIFTY